MRAGAKKGLPDHDKAEYNALKIHPRQLGTKVVSSKGCLLPFQGQIGIQMWAVFDFLGEKRICGNFRSSIVEKTSSVSKKRMPHDERASLLAKTLLANWASYI